MPFSLDDLEHRVIHTDSPEDLRDILVLIFHEVAMRLTGLRVEETGFETASFDDLHLAFYRTANEMVGRAHGRR